MPQVHINFLAVVVAAVVAFIIGGLWYSPFLFAKQWVKAHGYSDEQVAEMQKGAGKAYAVTLVCDFLIALAIAVLVGYIHMDRCVQGLKLGLLIWAGFAFPLGLVANMFSGKRLTVFYIDTAYQLVYLLIMSAIIVVWH
jgi:F0F1-type ATP synthase assembly protein I